MARDIETHDQVLNYSQQLHECFKGSNSAALFRPHMGTADSHSQCFFFYCLHSPSAQAALIIFGSISAAD